MAYEKWADVFALVVKETNRLVKEHPTKKRTDCSAMAWKTKVVLDARKEFDKHKAEREKKAKK